MGLPKIDGILERDITWLTFRIEYDASNNPIYIGYAEPGASETAPVWCIIKYEYDANGNATQKLFAGGHREFIYRWDQRATYSYS